MANSSNIINLGAERWFREMLRTLPEGTTVRQACMEEQRREIELFSRMEKKAKRS